MVLLLTTLGSQSFAQFGGGGMGGGRRGRGSDNTSNGAGLTGPQVRSSQLNEKLGDLRLRLSITSEQSNLWQAFYDRVFDLSDRSGISRPPPEDGETAPQATQQRLAEARSRTAALQRVHEAVMQLYLVLTPEQQHIADQYLPPVVP